jgi:hypothetical protein
MAHRAAPMAHLLVLLPLITARPRCWPSEEPRERLALPLPLRFEAVVATTTPLLVAHVRVECQHGLRHE